jgi:heme-degrading monooxygenase HmoA
MYARVTTARYQNAEAIDEGTRIYHDAIFPSPHHHKGFKDIIALVDRSTGKAMMITFWETEDDAQADTTSGFVREQVAKFTHLLSGAPISEVFEVVPVKRPQT